jgi:tRNA G10  N-methylase Trm11
MYIALLGRQPKLSIAELERLYEDVSWYTGQAATFEAPAAARVNVQRLGGSQKIGTVVLEGPTGDWRSASNAIVKHYSKQWAQSEHKITLGISAYDFRTNPRDIQKTGLLLKSKLKQSGVSLRLIPNQDVALTTATSHHNKLGLSPTKVELLVFRGKDSIIIAESTGAQNITALAARDQGRPRRDAFVGMLPPKLAQIMINLAVGAPLTHPSAPPQRILDPFCGTGVILQEAALLGQAVYGTDLAEKMIRYSRDNLNWLKDTYQLSFDWYLHEGDAMDAQWQQPIDAIASEAYLGQPFSAPPSPSKLTEVRGNCNHIIGAFLKNAAAQLKSGTPLAVAVPAWRDKEGRFSHLPLVQKLGDYGYERIELQTVESEDLLYYRPDQVVAREILLLKKK